MGEILLVYDFSNVASSHCVKWQSLLLNRYHSTAAGWVGGREGLAGANIRCDIYFKIDLNGCM